MYKELYAEYLSHLRSKNITEQFAQRRGFIFLHSYFLWHMLTKDCQVLIAKNRLEIHDLSGYLVPYHTAKGRVCGTYRIYTLGKLQKITWHDPLDMLELNYVTNQKFVNDIMRADAK